MPKRKPSPDAAAELASELKIIGGRFRGRRLRYELFQQGGDPVTRPMKHRVREAIFNLIGVEVAGKHALDLFAGTGALGLEALSRGAAHATFIERHVPAARVIEENVRTLGVADQAEVLATSAFLWGRRMSAPQSAAPTDLRAVAADVPWLVFCSPPYAFFEERLDEMQRLIAATLEFAPPKSVLVVEADERLDFAKLTALDVGGDSFWDVRTYPPAVVGVGRKP
jgi:16S rRNA (guanine966-N2)-methyltransferase